MWNYNFFDAYGDDLKIDDESELYGVSSYVSTNWNNRPPRQNRESSTVKELAFSKRCFYCMGDMITLPESRVVVHESDYHHLYNDSYAVVCPLCGWWKVIYTKDAYAGGGIGGGFVQITRCGGGVLKELDVSDLDTPLLVLRRYLIAKYESRFHVNPRKLEEIVCSIFADFGYKGEVTPYSGDNGIDIFLMDGKGNREVGIQVKRYKNKIQAEHIRSLSGALLLNGVTKGVFVTTSDFTKGANRTASKYDKIGFPIKLVDSEKLLQHLKIAQKNSWDRDELEAIKFQFWDRFDKMCAVSLFSMEV